MRYFSMFSGIGGFELGIKQAHELFYSGSTRTQKQETNTQDSSSDIASEHTRQLATCVGYSEIDKYAIKIYEQHFTGHKNFGDATAINPNELPDFDLLVGGFPCQSFSIAGKRRGFEDTRGTLFFDIARILRAKQPTNFVLENVKGLLSHNNGQTFRTIIATLTELGYDVEWQVLNSKNFGVPQNRERVYIVGHLRGESRPKVFPLRECGQADIVLPTLTARYYGAQANGGYIREKQAQELNYVGAIMSEKNKKWLEDGKQLSRNFPQGQRVYKTDGISSTIASQSGGLGGKTGLYQMDNLKIRRLTPKECERLQGFPDNWTVGLSDTQRYKTLGNAVTVNVVQVVMSKLICHSIKKQKTA